MKLNSELILLNFLIFSFVLFKLHAEDNETLPTELIPILKLYTNDFEHSKIGYANRSKTVKFFRGNPQCLKVLKKRFPDNYNAFMQMVGHETVYTFAAEKDFWDYFKEKYSQKTSNKAIYKKWLMIKDALEYGMGSQSTLDYVSFVENQNKEITLKDVFKYNQKFIAVYNDFKKAIQNNAQLFKEMGDIKPKDVEGWKAVTLSYTLEKFNSCKKTNLETGKTNSYGTEIYKELKDLNLLLPGKGPQIELFLNDFMQVAKNEKTVLKKKDIEPKLLTELFHALSERGGRYDLNYERIIKNIVTYSSQRRFGNSELQDAVRSDRLSEKEKKQIGLVSVQTLLIDSKGKIRYIFSFANGKWISKRKLSHSFSYQPYLFWISKVIYNEGKPVDLISSEVYADGRIKKLINNSIRSKYKVDFNILGDEFDPRPGFASSYDLSNFRFHINLNRYYFPLMDFPETPLTESKEETLLIYSKGMINPSLMWREPPGTELIP